MVVFDEGTAGRAARDPIPIPPDVRALLDAPNYVHLSTLRLDGSPRNHDAWVGLEDEGILVCAPEWTWKARDMTRDARVAMSVTAMENPCQMAALQGSVIEVRNDADCRFMNPIAVKYTGRPWPAPGGDRRCLVIAVHRAGQVTLWLRHAP